MTDYIPTKGRKSHVYVLNHHVAGRNVVPAETNACRQMLERHRDELPEGLEREFNAYLAAEANQDEALRTWCKQFIEECYAGGPWTTRKGIVVQEWMDADGNRSEELNMPMMALRYLVHAGEDGGTHKDMKAYYGIASDGFGGFLSAATKVGAISCLEETR